MKLFDYTRKYNHFIEICETNYNKISLNDEEILELHKKWKFYFGWSLSFNNYKRFVVENNITCNYFEDYCKGDIINLSTSHHQVKLLNKYKRLLSGQFIVSQIIVCMKGRNKWVMYSVFFHHAFVLYGFSSKVFNEVVSHTNYIVLFFLH